MPGILTPLSAQKIGPLSNIMGGAAVPWYLTGGISASNCIAAYQPKGAASLAASYSNLINAGTYDATPGTAPAWDSTNGWKFTAGSNHYLRTGITSIPQNQIWSFVVRFSGGTGNFRALFGSYKAATGAYLMFFPDNGGSQAHYYHYNNKAVAPAATSGTFAMCGRFAYRNGTLDGTITAGGNGANLFPDLYIGALNNNDTGILYPCTANIQAFAAYNTDISSYIAGLTTAMNAL